MIYRWVNVNVYNHEYTIDGEWRDGFIDPTIVFNGRKVNKELSADLAKEIIAKGETKLRGMI